MEFLFSRVFNSREEIPHIRVYNTLYLFYVILIVSYFVLHLWQLQNAEFKSNETSVGLFADYF